MDSRRANTDDHLDQRISVPKRLLVSLSALEGLSPFARRYKHGCARELRARKIYQLAIPSSSGFFFFSFLLHPLLYFFLFLCNPRGSISLAAYSLSNDELTILQIPSLRRQNVDFLSGALRFFNSPAVPARATLRNELHKRKKKKRKKRGDL